jgi:hypothetical protein
MGVGGAKKDGRRSVFGKIRIAYVLLDLIHTRPVQYFVATIFRSVDLPWVQEVGVGDLRGSDVAG